MVFIIKLLSPYKVFRGQGRGGYSKKFTSPPHPQVMHYFFFLKTKHSLVTSARAWRQTLADYDIIAIGPYMYVTPGSYSDGLTLPILQGTFPTQACTIITPKLHTSLHGPSKSTLLLFWPLMIVFLKHSLCSTGTKNRCIHNNNNNNKEHTK